MLKLWHKLFTPVRIHNRVNGPVVIDPELTQTIHVIGKGK